MSPSDGLEISAAEFATAYDGQPVDRFAVVDVREASEFVAGHVPGARLVPMSQLAVRLGELDPSLPVFVICATGNRSRPMAELLRARGLSAWSVAGGTRAWVATGRPLSYGIHS